MKSLDTVQKIFKVLKVIALAFAIVMFMSGGLCLVSGIAMIASRTAMFEIAGSMLYNISGELPADIELTPHLFTNLGIVMVGLAVMGIAAGVVLMLCNRYCGRVLAEGTPFTHGGADALLRLGIIALITEVAAVMVMEILITATGLGDMVKMNAVGSALHGISLMLLSRLFKYGADLRQVAEGNLFDQHKLPTNEEQSGNNNGPDLI